MYAKLGFIDTPVSRRLKHKRWPTLRTSLIASTMSFNLQLFLLFLKTTLRYGLLGFTLSMFLDILIIIFLYSSLHNRHLMSQARQTRHFERSAKRKTRGGEKWSACYQSIFLALPPTYANKYWLTPMMSKGPTKTRSITRKLSPFWLLRNTDSSIKLQG